MSRHQYHSILPSSSHQCHLCLRLQGRDCTLVSTQDKVDFIKLHLPNCQCSHPFPKVKKAIASALSHWLRLVVEHNGPFVQPTKQEHLVKCYDNYMKDVVGLSRGTREYRRRYAAEFLTWITLNPKMQLDSLTFHQLSLYVSQRAETVSLAILAVVTSSLNSFLRFCSIKNHCAFGVDIIIRELTGE
jgi:hypothetical protein